MSTIFVTAPDRARGVETETFRLDPSPLKIHGEERRAFRYDLVAGNDVTDAVRLTNTTDDVRSFRVYAADAEERDGAVIVEPFGAPDDAVGSWITVERQDVTLLPRSSEVVPFNIRRPEDQHAAGLGAIVAEEIRDDEGGAGFEVVYRLAITVHVSGDATGLTVTEPQLELPLALVPADGDAEAVITNDTLQPVEARVAFSVESLTGREWSLDPLDVRLDPGEARAVSQSWSTVPRWGGVFRVRAETTWTAGTVAATNDRGLYPPLWLLALAILAVGVRGLREMWNRRQERRQTQVSAPAPDPDALRERLIEAALWLHAAGRDAPTELREAAATEARAVASEAERTPNARDIQRAARSLEAFARELESGDESARRSANDFDTWFRQQRDDPRIEELVGS